MKLWTILILGIGVAQAESRPAPEQCPALARDGDLVATVHVAKGESLDCSTYHKMHFVPGNHKPVPASFWISPEAALSTVLAMEAKNPRVIPAAFRARVAAHPRDAALRVEMANCETETDGLHRRAALDAGIAVLLGTPVQQVATIIEHGSFDGDKPIAAEELVIEDALTRALLRHTDTGRGPDLGEDSSQAWMGHHLIRCGKLICQIARYSGQKHLVLWDLRDSGCEKEVPLSRAEIRAREQCLEHTDQRNQEDCLESCRVPTGRGTTISGDGCVLRCKHWCK